MRLKSYIGLPMPKFGWGEGYLINFEFIEYLLQNFVILDHNIFRLRIEVNLLLNK